jgi:ferredoxin
MSRLPTRLRDVPKSRFDERDIAFSRVRLKPGSAEYETYYALRTENKRGDDEIRALPGLLSPDASLADPAFFAAADGAFFLTAALRDAVDGPVERRFPLPSSDPAKITDLLKSLALTLGAKAAGVAALRPHHVYSRTGRDFRRYGEPIPFEPGFALAFTVEMDERMVRAAPRAPTVLESARQYVEAARIAVPLAAAIRSWGHPARAHIDGCYRVIAPLVARDAGLGEIGRMGLLMTPRLGPRVRIGVVTTTLPLRPDPDVPDPSVVDFCDGCRKCARNCPAQAIPGGPREEIDGALRWRIDGDACFRYWNTIGTDCARCMAVCPYSHADNAFHNAVRWAIKKSRPFRRAAVRLDDLVYGAKPGLKRHPLEFR